MEQFESQLAEKDRLNADLSAEIQRLMDEYRVYINDKIALDSEINTYRILLEVDFYTSGSESHLVGRRGASQSHAQFCQQ